MADSDLELDARPVTAWELLGEKNTIFQTPDFQRPYEWEESEFRDLWKDLLSAVNYEGKHFLGQIIVVEKDKGETKTLAIIDGQQRLTTLSVLICAMRDVYKEKTGYENIPDQLAELLTTSNINGDNLRRLYLLNNSEDDKQYQLVYQGDAEKAERQVGAAYDYYYEHLTSITEEMLGEIRQSVLKDLSLIRTETADINSAYQVFQTENDRGKDLAAIDLVKSILFEEAARNQTSNPEYIKRMWLEIVDNLSEVDQAGARRPLSHILALSPFKTPLQMWKEQFVRIFQEIVRERLDDADWSISDFIEFLKEESETYISANNYSIRRFSHSENKEINQKIKQFRCKNPHGGIATYHLIRNFDSPDTILSALDLANILNVRINISDMTASKARDPIYKIANSGSSDEELLEHIRTIIEEDTPTDSALVETIKTRPFKQNRLTKYILLEIERMHFNGVGYDDNHTFSDVQIEHIAPRKAFSKDKYSSWRSKLEHDEDRFNTYCQRLGNITLLTERQNARAGANPFQTKKREYRTSEFGMTKQLCEYDDWEYNQIDQRTKDLANLLVKTWSI
ncbi:DUF262 domain-containing protein [Natrinema pallidum]|uniref:DUF262 domain-containing protein n=1 Tax=Natrinema pallidum TaxID=69527 RepID=A0A4V1IFE8_9EURY|nr:DUF262 domain-containing protein [Natrinema pallidum]QCW04744.1 DUF262 domain-containing protein [Natrinema pallidum]